MCSSDLSDSAFGLSSVLKAFLEVRMDFIGGLEKLKIMKIHFKLVVLSVES